MTQQFDYDAMLARWNAGDDSVLDLAREIVADSKAATSAAEARYQKASVVWHAGMTARLSGEPARYMDLDTMTWMWVAPDVDIEALRVTKDQAKAALDAIEQPLRATHINAEVFISQIEAADARARAADEIALTERIAYGER
jgi:hypothetical protein